MMTVSRSPAVSQARRHRDASQARWKKHVKICHACTVADRTKEYINCCDDGWLMAKALTRATVNLASIEELRYESLVNAQETIV